MSSLVAVSGSTPQATKPLSYKRIMELFSLCGDAAPESFFRENPDLTVNERGVVYFLRMTYSTSFRTVECYARSLAKFFAFLHEVGTPTFTLVTPELLTNYITSLKSQGLKASTINTYMAAIKSFYSLMVSMGMIQGNPAKIFKRRLTNEIATLQKQAKGKLSGHVTKSLSQKEVDALFEFLFSNESVRNAVLIYFLYTTGARSIEIENLRWGDIYDTGESGWFVRLRGKGAKEREVYLPIEILEHIMILRRHSFQVPPYITAPGLDMLPVFAKAGDKSAPMSYSAIYRTVRKCCQRAGLGKKVSPHWLRHTHATHLRRFGASLEQIQAGLGHSSITTTQKYVHRNNRENPAGKYFDVNNPPLCSA